MDISSGIVAILAGIIGCFFGARYFSTAQFLMGFLVGFIVALDRLTLTPPIIELLVALFVGQVAALLIYATVTIARWLMGALLGILISMVLFFVLFEGTPEGLPFVLWLAIGGLIGFALARLIKRQIILPATAFIGAAGILYGIGQIVSEVTFLTPQQTNVSVIAWVLLGGAGVVVQLYDRRRRAQADAALRQTIEPTASV
jgi:Domain of unknown function (DUF4203)